ncbi:hypothetical protein ACFVWT_21210 [Arthrobacter sp. NPDC058288]|uniref:hypothetical protein n=1 Tax=Arthrobacter sp. NPDC058288 TaxID=3346424 RepID=UPI0036E86487
MAVLPSPVLHSPVLHPADGGYYRYRGRRKPDAAAARAEELRQLLREDRQRISFNASSMRALSVRLNQHIAQALCDGVKMTGLAKAAGLSRWAVRTIGLSSDDLAPSGLPAEQQLAEISRLKSELAELEESKAHLEGRRLKLLAAARQLGVMDEYELAALSGLQSEAIRKMTWGLQRVRAT